MRQIHFFAAGVSALALTIGLVGVSHAGNDDPGGKPRNFDKSIGAAVGYGIWKEADGYWYLCWTADGSSHEFNGKINAQGAGKIEVLESFDGGALPGWVNFGAAKQAFIFKTSGDRLGGLRFKLSGRPGALTFNLNIDGKVAKGQVRVGELGFRPKAIPHIIRQPETFRGKGEGGSATGGGGGEATPAAPIKPARPKPPAPAARPQAPVAEGPAGRPTSFPGDDGRRASYHVWKGEGDWWYLMWTGDKRNDHRFNAKVVVQGNGKFTQVVRHDGAARPRFVNVGAAMKAFNFNTPTKATGGVRFKLEGSPSALVFNLVMDGSTAEKHTRVGQKGEAPRGMPLSIKDPQSIHGCE